MEKPLSPRIGFPGRVFIVWDVSYRCNYNCSYCCTHEPLEKPEPGSLAQGIMERFSSDAYSRYSSCHIRFSGGEPFMYPRFTEFLGTLLEYHTVEVSTNLSYDAVMLKEKLAPENLMLSSSFHPQFTNIHEFMKKVSFLKENRFDITVTMVAYPPFLEHIGYCKELVERAGVHFIIQPFKGTLNGRTYPAAFTDEENRLLREYAQSSVQKRANEQMHETHGYAVKIEDRICRMGQMYAKIDTAGNIYRCCSLKSGLLGNVYKDGLRLLDEPRQCGVTDCPCWKAMIVGEEGKWDGLWNYPRHPKLYREEAGRQ